MKRMGCGGSAALVLLLTWAVTGAAGCAHSARWHEPRWIADYDTAEKQMRRTERELLIWYKDPRPGRSDPLQPILESEAVAPQIEEYVRCALFKSAEPDRRYLAQFGVERAPALVVVHRNGTYHAQVGHSSARDVSRFLAEAKPPGAPPTINPYVPRRADYAWHRNLGPARRICEETDRPLLVVYYRRLSRDWSALKALLRRHEVYTRLDDMIHCRIGIWNPWAQTRATPFGVVRLPALVIASGEGSHHVLEMPGTGEDLVRFADRYGQPDGTADANLAATGTENQSTAGLPVN